MWDSVNVEIYKKDEKQRYNPATEADLTFEKFMDYCEQNKYANPRTLAEKLNG